jgi:hypothetical protein
VYGSIKEKSQVAVVTLLIHFSRPLDGFLFRILGPTVKNNKITRYHIEYSLGAFGWPSTFPCYLHFNEHPPKKGTTGDTEKQSDYSNVFLSIAGNKKKAHRGKEYNRKMKSLIPNSQTLFKEIVPLNLLHAPTSESI